MYKDHLTEDGLPTLEYLAWLRAKSLLDFRQKHAFEVEQLLATAKCVDCQKRDTVANRYHSSRSRRL